MSPRTGRWLILLILLCGFALRVLQLESAPPGLHFDEAANLTLSGDIGLRSARPIFISSYTGKEVLFFYAAGGLMAALGESIFSLRLTAALFGTLTLAVTYRLGMAIFRDRRIALVAVVLLATSFWHLSFSRLGFRAISEPLLQGLTALFLLRLIQNRKPSWSDALWGGLFLGLTAYTYLAARLFPIALVLAFAPVVIRVDWLKQRGRYLVGTITIAAAVLAPLLAYFFRNPDAFWVRISQVSAAQITAWEGVRRALFMVGLAGDPYWRFNVPERPLFSPLWFLLLLFGGCLLAWMIVRPRPKSGRVGPLLLLITPFIMLLPTALATSEIVPSNLRAIGMLPFLIFWPALGAVWLIDHLLPKRRVTAWSGLITAVLLLEVGVGANLYFTQWATRTDLFYENNADLRETAAALDTLDPAAQSIFIAAEFPQHPTVAALANNYDAAKWIAADEAIVFAPEAVNTFIFPSSAPLPTWAIPIFEASDLLESGPIGPDGIPLYEIYTLAPPQFTPQIETEANFSFAISLLGYGPSEGVTGESIPILLAWEVLGRPENPVRPFFHLEDQWGYRWSQIEPDPYPSFQWEPGERIIQQVDIPVPADAPPGRYQVKFGWFDTVTGDVLARFDAAARFSGTSVTIDKILVETGTPSEASPPFEGVEVFNQLFLLDQDADTQVETGGRLNTELLWLAESASIPDLIIRYEIIPANRVGTILDETYPAHNTFPFSRWSAGQTLRDRQSIEIPTGQRPGTYTLQIRILGSDGAPIDRPPIPIGTLEVVKAERLFTPPEIEFETDLRFGGEIDLLGYSTTGSEDGGTLDLDLVWRATERPTADVTVFVHALFPDGVCCIWQLDQMPQGGGKPTASWVEGEIVIDRYSIPVGTFPAGEYPLEIGLYFPENGIRLRAEGADAADGGSDFAYLEPILVIGSE